MIHVKESKRSYPVPVTTSRMTIDELAREAGTTSRNIRALQSRGLLPPPELVGRTGYYDEDHLARINLIASLQERGFALGSIKEMIEAWEQGSSLGDVIGFGQALGARWTDETPTLVSRTAILEIFPQAQQDPALLDRAVGLGLLIPEGDGYAVPSPRLLQVGAELVRAGIPLSGVLDEAEALRNDTAEIAERFVQMFRIHIWEPFLEGKLAGVDLPEITQTMLALRPLAGDSVQAFLAQAMERAIEAYTMQDLQTQLESG